MRYLTRVVVACLAFVASLEAQSTWTEVPSPTTLALSGATYGTVPGLFVVVGDAGTILTSPDGNTWTPQISGTTAALRAVTYSASLHLFVAVGDQGTILTSPDAITWTSRNGATIQRLNAVAWGGGMFLAAGDNGTALVSSMGVTWDFRPLGTTSAVRSVVHGLGQFVMSGVGGTILTTNDGTEIHRRGIMAQGTLAALAFDGESFFVVGDQGLIAQSTDPHHWKILDVQYATSPNLSAATVSSGYFLAAGRSNIAAGGAVITKPGSTGYAALPSEIFALASGGGTVIATGPNGSLWRLEPPPIAFYVGLAAAGGTSFGDALTLKATAAGAGPFTYQWYRGLAPIPGATQSSLSFQHLKETDRDSYYVRVTPGTGTPASSPYLTVPVTPIPPDGAALDRTFRADLPATPTSLLVQPDGKLLVAGAMFFYPAGQPQYGVARLHADGSIDDSFRVNPLPYSVTDRITGLDLEPDGSVVVHTRDPLFSPSSYRLTSTGAPNGFYTAPTGIVLPGGGRVEFVGPTNFVLTVTRYDATGTMLDSFDVNLDTTPPSLSAMTNFASSLHAIDPQNRVIVAMASHQSGGTGHFGVNLTRLFRLMPDGTLDATLPTTTVNAGLTGLWCHPQTGQLYIRSGAVTGPLGSSYVTTFGRLHADATADLTYHGTSFTDFLGVTQSTVSTWGASSDGSYLLTSGSFRTDAGVAIVRYDREGALDPEFSAGVWGQSFGPVNGPLAVTAMRTLTDGSLIVGTDAPVVGGLNTGYLARVVPLRSDPGSRLANVSIRAPAGTDSATLIVGFTVAGAGNKTMLVRGVGPTLADFSVTDPLADPQLTLYHDQATIFANDDWSTGPTATEVATRGATLGAFPLATDSRDAAAVTAVNAGVFTMHVRSADAATGIVLAEAYDADNAPTDFTAVRIANFSARSPAGSGAATLIAGFTVSGSSAKRVLIRGIGPGLIPYDVDGALANPEVTVYAGANPFAYNDDWAGDPALAEAFTTVGAFALPTDSTDAALVLTLAPGTYTVHLRGVNAAAGIGLVEVYEMP